MKCKQIKLWFKISQSLIYTGMLCIHIYNLYETFFNRRFLNSILCVFCAFYGLLGKYAVSMRLKRKSKVISINTGINNSFSWIRNSFLKIGNPFSRIYFFIDVLKFSIYLKYIPILQYLVTPGIRITNTIAFTRKKHMCTHFSQNNWTITNIYNIFLIYNTVSFVIRIVEKDTKISMSLLIEFFIDSSNFNLLCSRFCILHDILN